MGLPTINVPDFSGTSTPINTPNAGRHAAADSASAALSNEDKASLDAVGTKLDTLIAKLNASIVVTGTFWQAAQPVSQSGAWNITNVTGTVSLPTGASTAANQSTIVAALGSATDATVTNGSAGTALAYLRTIKDGITSTAPSAVAFTTDSIATSTASLTPKFAKVQLSATGTIVAAVASKKIRVLQFWLSGAGAVNAKFQSHVGPTDLSGLLYIAAAGGNVSAGFCPVGLFETVAGEALDLNLSAAVAVGGSLVYIEV